MVVNVDKFADGSYDIAIGDSKVMIWLDADQINAFKKWIMED